MKKLGIWVKARSALGSYQATFRRIAFSNESRAGVTPLTTSTEMEQCGG